MNDLLTTRSSILVFCLIYCHQLYRTTLMESDIQQHNIIIERLEKQMAKLQNIKHSDEGFLPVNSKCDVENAILLHEIKICRQQCSMLNKNDIEEKLSRLQRNLKHLKISNVSWKRTAINLLNDIANLKSKLHNLTTSERDLQSSTERGFNDIKQELQRLKKEKPKGTSANIQITNREDTKLLSEVEESLTQLHLLLNQTRVNVTLLEGMSSQRNILLSQTRVNVTCLEGTVTQSNVLLNLTWIKMKRLEGDLTQNNILINHTLENITLFEEKIKKLLTNQTASMSRLKNLEDFNTKPPVISALVVAFMFVVLSIIFKINVGLRKKVAYLLENKDKPILHLDSLSIIEKVKRRQESELKNQYCIISFSPENHSRHRRIAKNCLGGGRRREKNMTETTFIIREHKNVLELPAVKVMLVFIEYNQLDVILETPGQDAGDIKLLTVQACRKMGADVFVIYVGDEGSKSLMPGLLYNPQLTTVVEHFELKQLEQRDRVITLHEKFTISQREKVAEIIA